MRVVEGDTRSLDNGSHRKPAKANYCRLLSFKQEARRGSMFAVAQAK